MRQEGKRLHLVKEKCQLLHQMMVLGEQLDTGLQLPDLTERLDHMQRALDERQMLIDQIDGLDQEIGTAPPAQDVREEKETQRYVALAQELVRRMMDGGIRREEEVRRMNEDLTRQLYDVNTALRNIEAYFPELMAQPPREIDIRK